MFDPGILAALFIASAAIIGSALDHPRVRRWRSRVTGAVLVGLGVRLAPVERR